MPSPRPLQIVKPPDGRDVTFNTLLYGPPKTGKTAGACSLSGAVLLLNADLPNATRYAHRKHGTRLREVRMEGLQTLIDVTAALESQKPTFDAIVVDPISELYVRLLDDLSQRALRPALPLRGDVDTHIERFCRKLCELPVNVVFVCHEMPVKDESSGQFERLPFTGTSNPKLGQKIAGMVDVVGFTGVLEEEGQPTRYVAQLLNANGRRGGDRFDVLGKYRELDLAAWRDEIATSTSEDAPQAQKEAA